MFVETDESSISHDSIIPLEFFDRNQFYWTSSSHDPNFERYVENQKICVWQYDGDFPQYSDFYYSQRELSSPEQILQEIVRECEQIERNSSPSSTSSPPMSSSNVLPRKIISERKRAQNRAAASRYRERKRRERDDAQQLVAELEAKHEMLDNKAQDLINEIAYLKNLMRDVQFAAGQLVLN